jgi:hypothetical protein
VTGPSHIDALGVRCARMTPSQWVGQVAQLTIYVARDGERWTVSINDSSRCLAVGRGVTVEKAAWAAENRLTASSAAYQFATRAIEVAREEADHARH